MSEAKDWAGELISGQTGTGRILVSFIASIDHYLVDFNLYAAQIFYDLFSKNEYCDQHGSMCFYRKTMYLLTISGA